MRNEEQRILQGVLLKDFGDRELKKKERKALNKQKKNLRLTATAYVKRDKTGKFGNAINKLQANNMFKSELFSKGLKIKQ